jgi:cyanophycin synthetase
MLDHILTSAGVRVGMTTTTGIYIGGHRIKTVDASGPKSARLVLADPTVEAAVLETARGGMLREGLAYDRADVGIVLNVSADHLGLKGIDTLEKLATVKSIVVRNVRRRGTSILNADDPLTRKMAKHAGGRIVFFTARGRAEFPDYLDRHLAKGGMVAAVEPSNRGGMLVLHDAESTIEFLDAADVPATLAGAASFNVQNALVAATAAFVQGIDVAHIAEALREFEGSFEQNPGRMNVTRAPGFTAVLDYAHNPAALLALGEAVAKLRATHNRVIGVVSTPGDRRDEDIVEMGRIAATIFDEVVFRERPDGRGRSAGGVMALLMDGATAGGMTPERIHLVMDEAAAMSTALEMARADDLVVMTVTDVDAVWKQILAFPPLESGLDASSINEESVNA